MSTVVYQTCTNFVGLFNFKALLTMSRLSSSSSYEAAEDFMLSEQPDIKEDLIMKRTKQNSRYSHIGSSQVENCLLVWTATKNAMMMIPILPPMTRAA